MTRKGAENRIMERFLCGFTTEERKRIETTEHVSERDPDMVGIQESWEEGGNRVHYYGGP